MKFKVKIIAASVLIAASVFIGGCSEKKIDIKITDALTESFFSARPDMTVSQLLSEAEITVGKGDRVTPSLSSVISSSADITILRKASVNVICDDKSHKVTLYGGKVSDALKEAGVKLSSLDKVDPESDTYLFDGEKIDVTRRNSVSLKADGKSKKYVTAAKTVGDFITERKLTLGKRDILTPSKDTVIKTGMKITLKRVDQKTVTEKKTIRYSTEYVESDSMDIGTSEVTVNGQNGVKEVTYRLIMTDGRETGRQKLSEKVIKEPVNEVITQGTREQATETQPETNSNGKTEVSRQRVDDCDGSGHGYYVIKYSDGTEDYEIY